MLNKQIIKVELFCIVQLASLIFPLVIIAPLAASSGFSKSLPLQYAPKVLALFMTAMVVTIVNNAYSIIFEETSKLTKVMLFIPPLVISWIAGELWLGNFKEQPVDNFALLSLGFAVITMLVGVLEWYCSGWHRRWALVTWCVNFPMVVGLLATFLFKYLNYNDSSHAYISFMAENFKVPQGLPPEWPVKNKELQVALRINFWTGFSAGIIAIQIITAQIVSVALRLYEAFNPIENKS